MPFYDYRCDKCGTEVAEFSGMNDPRRTECPACDGNLTRVIRAPMIQPDLAAYTSIITGEEIRGRVAHRNHLEAHDCVEIGDQTSKRQRNYMDTEFESKLRWHKDNGKPLPPENVRDGWSKDA